MQIETHSVALLAFLFRYTSLPIHSIVEFNELNDETSVKLVSSSWISGDGRKCSWLGGSYLKIEKMLKALHQRSPDWPQYPVLKILAQTGKTSFSFFFLVKEKDVDTFSIEGAYFCFYPHR